jgi:carboxypeptidase Q
LGFSIQPRFLLIDLLFLVAVLTSGAPLRAQINALPLDTLEHIRAASLESDYGYTQLDYLCNKIGPRMTGTPQTAAAVQWVAARFRELGLETTLEPVMVPHWVRGEETAELMTIPGAQPGFTQNIVITTLGGSVATPATGITAPIVVVSDFAEMEKLGKEGIAGKIILFNAAFDAKLADAGYAHDAYVRVVPYRVSGASRAARLGAAAVLVRSIGPRNFRLAHTGSVVYGQGVQIPAAAIAAEDAELIAHLASQGTVEMHLVLTPKMLPPEKSANVIGDLKGSEHPDQIVMVSAHLDSWDLGTGAIDNGAGIAEIMQAAWVFRQLRLKPKRTIRFIAWMNEENAASVGNGYDQYREDHKTELPKHMGNIEIDVGTSHPIGYALFSSGSLREALRPLKRVLDPMSSGVVQIQSYRGDFDDFMPNLEPLVDSRRYYDSHHTVADTFAMIDPVGLRENAALVGVLGFAMASVPEEAVQHPKPPKSND